MMNPQKRLRPSGFAESTRRSSDLSIPPGRVAAISSCVSFFIKTESVEDLVHYTVLITIGQSVIHYTSSAKL